LGALLAAAAWACAPTATEVGRARAAFEDAEVELAGEILQGAVDDLDCQQTVVEGLVLLELYRLDGLVALSQLDHKGAVYATIRAVTVDPSAAPPAAYGPELADLHRTWSERLKNSTATIRVDGGGVVWVDGQRMTHGATRVVLQGHHLLQTEVAGELGSVIMEVSSDHLVQTGVPAPVDAVGPVPPSPVPVPKPVPLGSLDPLDPLDPELLDPDPPKKRRRPVALWAVGGLALAAGGASFGWAAYQDEVVFPNQQFPDQASVTRAAGQVRVAYGTGYGLMGVGGVLIVSNAVGFTFR